jgi:hypothetical protein
MIYTWQEEKLQYKTSRYIKSSISFQCLAKKRLTADTSIPLPSSSSCVTRKRDLTGASSPILVIEHKSFIAR